MRIKLATLCSVVCLLSIGLNNCASTQNGVTPLKFPADLEQPYLTLEQVVDGNAAPPVGFWKRMLGKLLGPRSEYFLDHPADITLDSQGRMLILDSGRGGLHRFIKAGSVWQFDQYLTFPQIKSPAAIVAGEQRLFVSDLHSKKIIILSEDLVVQSEITDSDFIRPGDLCYDEASQRLFISDPPAGKVFIYTATGEELGAIGLDESGPGQLQNPISVAVDATSGVIYVLDGLARKVKTYGADLSYLSSFGKYDQVPGSFAFPKDIVQSRDGVLFVSDAAFGNIQMFDPSGALLFFFGDNGTDPGQFLMPRNMYFDANQYLYVADPYNNRVQIFQYHVQP